MEIIYSRIGANIFTRPPRQPGMRLNDISNQRRREALSTLSFLNANGRLRSGPNGRGFVDARNPTQRLLSGITQHISDAPVGRVKRLLREGKVTPQFFKIGHWQGSVPTASDFHTGNVVHRALMHQFSCVLPQFNPTTSSPLFPISAPLDGGSCRCEAIHGKLRIKKTERVMLRHCIDAARSFVANQQLRPVLAEQVIVDELVGTRFDSLMAQYDKRTNTERIMLVSWKTGGRAMYEPGNARRDQIIQADRRNRYVMQVLYEAAMLRKHYNIAVDGAYIVNLMTTQTGGVGYFMKLDTTSIDAAPKVYAEMLRLAGTSD